MSSSPVLSYHCVYEVSLVYVIHFWRYVEIVGRMYLKLDSRSFFIWHQMQDLVGSREIVHRRSPFGHLDEFSPFQLRPIVPEVTFCIECSSVLVLFIELFVQVASKIQNHLLWLDHVLFLLPRLAHLGSFRENGGKLEGVLSELLDSLPEELIQLLNLAARN